MTNPASHDSLSRRRRDRRTSTGKRITLQPRDLIWLGALQTHGPLPSHYLHAFSKHIARSEKRARDRLTDLYNETETPDGGAYLDRPPQQFQTLRAQYQPLVYELGPAARKALRRLGLANDYATHAAGPWHHSFMVSSITASIELATLDRPDIVYIPGQRILERAKAKLRYPVSFREPGSGKQQTIDLIPDALFGLEYLRDGQKSYRFCLVEADRATEPTRASQFNRKSHLRNFLQYREYVGAGLYKQHLNLTAPMLVLNVSTDLKVTVRMLRLLGELMPEGCSYQLFQAVEGAGYLGPPKILTQLMEGRWIVVGKVQHFYIKIDLK
jgi:hypothetical protein